MNRTILLIVSALWALASLVTTASAEEKLNDLVAVCTECHGESGLPEDPEMPILWGQESYYLYVQLKDYKAGRRSDEIMGGMVEELDRNTMKALGKHFSTLAWPGTGYRTPEDQAAKARAALSAGQCVQCHLGGYEGNSRVPRLAGQQVDYLERTMLEFKNKVRLNSPSKGSLFAAYPDDQIAAMARYLAGL